MKALVNARTHVHIERNQNNNNDLGIEYVAVVIAIDDVFVVDPNTQNQIQILFVHILSKQHLSLLLLLTLRSTFLPWLLQLLPP